MEGSVRVGERQCKGLGKAVLGLGEGNVRGCGGQCKGWGKVI